MPDNQKAPPTDDQVVAAIRDGARTPYVADRLGLLAQVPYVRRRLKRLESAGRVRRSERYSFPHSIYWEAVNV